MSVPLGWGERLSAPHDRRLRHRRPRVHRRKRDCTPPSSSHLPRVLLRRRCVLRWRKDCTSGLPPRAAGLYFGGRGTGLLPHNNGDFLGGGGTGPPAHSNCVNFGGGETGPTPPHNVGKFLRHRWDASAIPSVGSEWAAAQMGRSGDTTISGWLTTCTRVQVVTARDALRRSGRFDDTIRMAGVPLTTWGRSGDTVVRVSGWLQVSFRSTSLAPCDGAQGWPIRRMSAETLWRLQPWERRRLVGQLIPRVLVSPLRTFCDTLRWVCGFRGHVRAGLPAAGAVYVCLCTDLVGLV